MTLEERERKIEFLESYTWAELETARISGGDADRLARIQSHIESKVNELSSAQERAILKLKYFDRMTFPALAEVIGYSVNHTKILTKRALDHFPIPTDDDMQVIRVGPSAVDK